MTLRDLLPARLAASAPHVRVIALSLASDESTVLQALLAGAAGYIVKDASTDEIVAAIRAAANGMSALSPGVTGAVLGRLRSAPGATEAEPVEEGPRPELTTRELEVLRHLVAGEDNKLLPTDHAHLTAWIFDRGQLELDIASDRPLDVAGLVRSLENLDHFKSVAAERTGTDNSLRLRVTIEPL